METKIIRGLVAFMALLTTAYVMAFAGFLIEHPALIAISKFMFGLN